MKILVDQNIALLRFGLFLNAKSANAASFACKIRIKSEFRFTKWENVHQVEAAPTRIPIHFQV